MLNLVKNIFGDIFVLYKNFFHFNFSKVLNILSTLFYLILFTAPIIIVMNFFIDFVKSTENISMFYQGIYYLINFLIYISIFGSILYFFTLQSNVNLNYLEGKKLGFLKNNYFNFKLLLNHFKIIFIYSIIFILLFIIFSIIFAGFISLADTSNLDNLSNGFAISSTILLFLAIIFVLYFIFTMLLSIVIMVDESKGKDFKSAFFYIKKAFKLSKGLVTKIKLLAITIIIFLLTLIIAVPLLNSMISLNNLNKYLTYKSSPESFGNLSTDSYEFYHLENLKGIYSGSSDLELKKELKISEIKTYLFLVLYFLIILGLFEMMLVSFYKRELLKNTKNLKIEDIKKEVEKKEIKTVTKKVPTKKKVVKKVEKSEEKKPVKKVVKKTTTKKKIAVKKEPVVKKNVKKVVTKKTPVKKVVKKVTPKK